MSNQTADRRGVVPRKTQSPAPDAPITYVPEPVRGEAWKLAMANRHKPWARRYLRANGRLW